MFQVALKFKVKMYLEKKINKSKKFLKILSENINTYHNMFR